MKNRFAVAGVDGRIIGWLVAPRGDVLEFGDEGFAVHHQGNSYKCIHSKKVVSLA